MNTSLENTTQAYFGRSKSSSSVDMASRVCIAGGQLKRIFRPEAKQRKQEGWRPGSRNELTSELVQTQLEQT